MPIDFEVTMNEYLPLRDVVFNTLRRAILRGELKPGERLMEIQLANKLGVSRTPVREAVFQPSAKLVLCCGRFRNIVHLFSCFCLLSLLSIFIIFAPRLKLKT